MKHFGRKVVYKKWKFDSEKERDFFIRFIEHSGKRFEVHKSFELKPKTRVCGYNQHSLRYSPDFVIYDENGEMVHVYDVKTGISDRAVDAAAKIRFVLFGSRYNMPVEVVVPRRYDFKMKLFGFTDYNIQPLYVRRSNGGKEVHEHYNVYKTINYDIHDLVGR